jgi:hypothetical protein
MRIYVASKFENKARTREIMAILEGAGHWITYDWTQDDGVLKQAQAVADLDGVLEADAFVLLVEEDLPYCSTLVEFGAALGAGTPVFIVGHALDARCLFTRHPRVWYATPETLLRKLDVWVPRRGPSPLVHRY